MRVELKLFAREPFAGGADYHVPADIATVIAAIGLIGLPVHLASSRERGVLRQFRAAGTDTSAVRTA
jgi:ABC-2 type transport system permease protein